MPLITEAESEVVKKNLELYGGYFVKQLNGFNNFSVPQYVPAKSTTSDSAADETAKAEPQQEAKPKGDIKEFLKKAVEVIKKVATYEIGSGKK